MTRFERENTTPADRRKSLRIPVDVSVKIRVSHEKSGFFGHAELTDYSNGGVGIRWNICNPCTGYTPGDVHPDCIFGPFSVNISGSGELFFHLELANIDKDITFSGKAVYTLREQGIEKIGITFTQISDDMLDFMKKVF